MPILPRRATPISCSRRSSEGGHSSNPYGGTSLEVLSRAIAAICDIEWPTRVTDSACRAARRAGALHGRRDCRQQGCHRPRLPRQQKALSAGDDHLRAHADRGRQHRRQRNAAGYVGQYQLPHARGYERGRCRGAAAARPLPRLGLAGRVEVELGPGSSEPSPSPRVGGPGLEAVRSIAARYFRDSKGDGGKRIIRGEPEPMAIVPSTVIGATDAANYQRICH